MYPAFPARTYCLESESVGTSALPPVSGCGPVDDEVWFHSTVPGYEEYIWKAETSSDSIDGYMAVLPLMLDHIAANDAQRDRVRSLVVGLTGSILDNDLYLIDPSTGLPTKWGFWNPDPINKDPERYGERGGNSLAILAYTASAYSISTEDRFKDTFWKLVKEHGYDRNALNAKTDCPYEDNHSDNELLYMTYHTFFNALNRIDTLLDAAEGEEEVKRLQSLRAEVDAMVEIARPSVDRTYNIVSGERSPLWLGMFAGVFHRPASEEDINAAVWSLRHWGLDMIDWPVDNSIGSSRWDINKSPYYPRDSPEEDQYHLMREILPPQERATQKWNSDPYVQSYGGGGVEEAPYIWRLPYHVMLYFKLL